MSLKYTKFTCTHYAHGDTVGKALAYAALTPLLLVFYRASRFYSRREVHEGVFFVGCLANEALARLLKHLLKHPRPSTTCAALNLCQSHGMPSSHTQMMFFILALSACLAAYRRLWLKPPSTRLPVAAAGWWSAQVLVAAMELLALAAAAVLVAASRVYLGYHSLDQVAVGAVLGAGLGALWFALMLALAPAYRWVATLRPASWIELRDTWGLGVGVHALEREMLGQMGVEGGIKKVQ